MKWFHFAAVDAPLATSKQLKIEQVDSHQLAQKFGTPLYVYSKQGITAGFQAYQQELAGSPHLICYAVKANSNLAVLNLLAQLGAGFDIVSIGELERVITAGGDPAKVVFSGVGKQVDEIRRALQVGVLCFNVESFSELYDIQAQAQQLNKTARIALRINPNVDPKTHPYIATGLKESKFGIAIDDALALYEIAAQCSHIEISGVDCHIGSQITDTEPFMHALQRLILLIKQLQHKGITLSHLDIGGGLGVDYEELSSISPQRYLQSARQLLYENGLSDLTLIVEPGRSIVAQAGILLTSVTRLKQTSTKHFAIVDAAMNDLIRPALYQAKHTILNTQQRAEEKTVDGLTPQKYDIVGAICESGDYLAKAYTLSLQRQDLLAIFSTGAYGFSMSSNYNSRGRAAEVIVDYDQAYLVRRRETIADLYANEYLLPNNA